MPTPRILADRARDIHAKRHRKIESVQGRITRIQTECHGRVQRGGIVPFMEIIGRCLMWVRIRLLGRAFMTSITIVVAIVRVAMRNAETSVDSSMRMRNVGHRIVEDHRAASNERDETSHKSANPQMNGR